METPLKNNIRHGAGCGRWDVRRGMFIGKVYIEG